jgi:hypothetical protein
MVSLMSVNIYDEFCYSNKSAIVSKAQDTMIHLYGVHLSATTNTSATNIPAPKTSSAELCSIATDDMTLSNETTKCHSSSVSGSNFDFKDSKRV